MDACPEVESIGDDGSEALCPLGVPTKRRHQGGAVNQHESERCVNRSILRIDRVAVRRTV